MADGKYVAINAAGGKTEEQAIAATSGATDADKIIRTNALGLVDETFQSTSETLSLTASETLAANDLVNIWDDAGTPKIRKADASNNMPVHGFVKDAVTIATAGIVHGEGKIGGASLAPGAVYYLSATVPGAFTTTVPTTTGHLLQPVGVAYSASILIFEKGEAIPRA